MLLSSQEAYRERFGKAEISSHEAVVSAMAAGLVIDVWRNGPVEDMHCGKRGPDDAAMFAESTSLHDQAVTALTAGNRPIGLLEFEDHLLDRERPWAGTGGTTLKDLGHGFLGQYRLAREGPHQQTAGLSRLPASEPTPSVFLRFDGWILPKAGVAFVWVLDEEMVRAAANGHRAIAP